MKTLGNVVKLSIDLDDSALGSIVGNINRHIEDQRNQINELKRTILGIPQRSELESLRKEILEDIDRKNQKISDRITKLEGDLNQKFDEMKREITDQVAQEMSKVDLAVKQKIAAIEPQAVCVSSQSPDAGEIERFGEEISANRRYIMDIANAISNINNTKVSLGDGLGENLKQSTNTIKANFAEINDTLSFLKSQLKRGPSGLRKTERVVTGQSEFDWESAKMYGTIQPDWKRDPSLPELSQFKGIGDLVDYVYKVVPSLNASLKAMHDKMMEMIGDVSEKIDKSVVENLFNKFQKALSEISSRCDGLKDAVEKTATRDEVNALIASLDTGSTESGTSIGRVRCIACGRECPQIIGAIAEDEAIRKLGNPPNGIAYQANIGSQQLGVLYTGTDGFDGGIVEMPRAVRPVRILPKKSTN